MDFSADAAELTMQQLLLPRSWYILHMLWEETLRCVLRGLAAHDTSHALTHNRLSSNPTAQGANCGITEQQRMSLEPETSNREKARHRRPLLVEAGPLCLVCRENIRLRLWREDQSPDPQRIPSHPHRTPPDSQRTPPHPSKSHQILLAFIRLHQNQ